MEEGCRLTWGTKVIGDRFFCWRNKKYQWLPFLPPIIMEVENGPIVEETIVLYDVGTHSPLPWLWEEE